MDRARRHQRLLSGLAFGLLALVAELAGRSLTYRLDVGRHVSTPGYAGADYYPFLLAAVKVGIALLLARLAWRFARAHAAAQAARRLLAAVGSRPCRAPRVRVVLSARLWLASFLVTSLFYLVQTDAERLSSGQWPPLSPWLHTSALPVFAVLAVLVAVVWGAVARWLADYERFAEAAVADAHRAVRASQAVPARRPLDARPPRRLFGLAFESRPPPVPA
jgi:putative intracellular protease/amidase